MDSWIVNSGTIIGKPPCYEHVYSNRANSMFASNLENCEVAIKILPRYASELARHEFMAEIELMKTIEINENIVRHLHLISSIAESITCSYFR